MEGTDIEKKEESTVPLDPAFEGSLGWNKDFHLPVGPRLLAVSGLETLHGLEDIKKVLEKFHSAQKGPRWLVSRIFLFQQAVEYVENNFLRSTDSVFCNLGADVLKGLYAILSIDATPDSKEGEDGTTTVKVGEGTAKIVYLNDGEDGKSSNDLSQSIDPKTGWRSRGAVLQYPSSNVTLTKEQETVFAKLEIMMNLAQKNAQDQEAAAKTINDFIFHNRAHFAPLYYIPTYPQNIDQKMKDLLSTWKEQMEKLLSAKKREDTLWKQKILFFASWFHQSILLIRPFPTCNGRIARIIFNCVLVRFGFDPCWFENMDQVLVYKNVVIKSVKRRDISFVRPFYCQVCERYKIDPETKKIKTEMNLKYKFL